MCETMYPNSTKSMVKELLTETKKSLSIVELMAGIEQKFKIKKTKQQIRNALNSYDCKDVVRISDGVYDLLSRIVNGIYFRYTLTSDEIGRGILYCDAELKFIFDFFDKDDNRDIMLQFSGTKVTAKKKFCGPNAVPRRLLEVLDGLFKVNKVSSGDDIIIKVIDSEKDEYEIAFEKKGSRNEELIRKKNKEAADVLHKVASRIDLKGGWIDMLTKRVICEYSYKDPCPPDTISRIAETDGRFTEVKGTLGGIYLKNSRIMEIERTVASFYFKELDKDTKIFQFKINLEEIKPVIWRRIQVPSSYTFWDLHVAIQDAMGWFDCHLHEFQVKDPLSGKKVFIGIPDEFSDSEMDRETFPGWNEPITKWFSLENDTAKYIYDFGDDWNHAVKLEKIMSMEKDIKYPRCVGGECACPPEDVGSTSGYFEFVEIMKNSAHSMHKEMVEWIGDDEFNPEKFDCNEVVFDDPRERFKREIENSEIME